MAIRRNPNRKPTHPGEMIQEFCMKDENGRQIETEEQASARTGIDLETFNRLLDEEISVTPEIADKLAIAWSSAGFWLRLQGAFDEWKARQTNE